MLSGEDLVGHDAECVEIGTIVDVGIARGLLRRHVRRRANLCPGLRDRRLTGEGRRGANRAGDPEIGDHRCAFAQQHVLGLDVAVDDPLPVRVRERPGDVAQHTLGLVQRQRSRLQPLPERRAGDIGHRIVRQSVDVTRRQQGDDMRVLKTRGEPDLALEALRRHAGAQVRRQQLDHDVSAESPVLGEKDARHAAAAQLSLDGVRRSQRVLQTVAEVVGHSEM